MDLVVADDARQLHPTRPGAGPLVATGGIYVPGDSVRPLERKVQALCSQYGFPPGEEFKWSPTRNHWMYQNLIGERRHDFFVGVIRLCQTYGVKALVVIEDSSCGSAAGFDHEMDATKLFLERVHKQLLRADSDAVLLVDRPSGDRASEDRFLIRCIETVQRGTSFVTPDRISLVVSAASELVHLIQVADVVTSCTLARVAGEERYSPPLFDEFIRPLLLSETGRIGGVGLKLHPDFKYANLYHWLLGDTHYVRFGNGIPLPLGGRRYASDPMVP